MIAASTLALLFVPLCYKLLEDLSACAAQQQLDITERTLAARLESMRIERLRFVAGQIDELAYREAESQLPSALLARRPDLRAGGRFAAHRGIGRHSIP